MAPGNHESSAGHCLRAVLRPPGLSIRLLEPSAVHGELFEALEHPGDAGCTLPSGQTAVNTRVGAGEAIDRSLIRLDLC